jgi:transposase, IS30 family
MDMSKHLSLSERKDIELLLKEGKSFKEIGRTLGKDCTTISKEIRYHLIERKSGAWGQPYNACILRFGCEKYLLCKNSNCEIKKCTTCNICNNFCKSFIEEKCKKLDNPPYVCNGCNNLKKCTLCKKFYAAKDAQEEYEYVYSESRTGIAITESELSHLDRIITPLIKNGQSIHHICVNNADKIMYSEKTLYNYVDSGLITACNMDLPRKVKYRPRKKVGLIHKVDRKCRIGRTYDDFKNFMEMNNHPLVVEMDSVIGRIGGKVLLTLHFVKAEFMLAFLRDTNDSQSVIDIFDRLNEVLEIDMFKKLFPVLLTDNGSEFSNPTALECDRTTGEIRTSVFYCDPGASFQKGAAEKNHEEIRKVLPKGTSFDNLVQKDIDLMMNHINSYSRASLNDKTPYDTFRFIFGEDAMKKLGSRLIHPNEICLKPSLLKM